VIAMDTLQHLRLSRLSPPTSLSLHGMEKVALRCSASLRHLDIDLNGKGILVCFCYETLISLLD
jgi:hypothetical protein